MNLADLQKEAHAIAKAHGWWDEERTFGDLIALVHSELSEALEAYRERELEAYTPPDDVIGQPGKLGTTRQPHPFPGVGGYVNVKVSTKPRGVASELADVVIRVADMAEHYDWDLSGWEDADISHTIVDPTFGDWICLIHGSLTWAFVGLCTTLQRSEWIEPLKTALRLVNDMAAHYGIDLDAAIELKMAYNRTRPYRHGGKAL